MNERVLFNSDGETAAEAVMAALSRRGLYVIRSFDLRSALAAHDGCECPYHGTAKCACQFIVLLVYGDSSTISGLDAAEPITLTAHCRDGRTEARIVRDAAAIPDPHFADLLMAALAEAAITLQAVQVSASAATAHA